MNQPNAKNRGSKREKGKNGQKSPKNDGYESTKAASKSNYTTSACVCHVGALECISTCERCLCLEQGIPARRYGRITLRGGALHNTRNSQGSNRRESKCKMWVMCEFWQALQTMGV